MKRRRRNCFILSRTLNTPDPDHRTWSWTLSKLRYLTMSFASCNMLKLIHFPNLDVSQTPLSNHHHHHHHHQSLNNEGRWGTTDDFATSFLNFFPLFSTDLLDLANSRPVHSLMLSSHFFFCPPCLLPLLPTFIVSRKMDLARPDERETWLFHCSSRFFTMVRSLRVIRISAESWQQQQQKDHVSCYEQSVKQTYITGPE